MPAATVAASLPSCCPVPPKPLNFHRHAHRQRNLTTLSLSTTHSKIPISDFSTLTLRHPHRFINFNSNHSQSQTHPLFLQFLLSIVRKDTNNQHPEPTHQKLPREDEPKGCENDEERRVHFTNMGLAEMKAALGQRINLEAIYSALEISKELFSFSQMWSLNLSVRFQVEV